MINKPYIPHNAFEIMIDNYIYPVIVAATVGFFALLVNIIKKSVENWTKGIKEDIEDTNEKIEKTSDKIDKISKNAIEDRDTILKAISSIEIAIERITNKQLQVDIQLLDANDRINDILKELREKDKDSNELRNKITQLINYHKQHHEKDSFQ